MDLQTRMGDDGVSVTVAEAMTDCDERRCGVGGCDRPYLCRGWCRLHYERWRKHGDPLMGAMRRWPANLLDSMEPQPDGCIYFTGLILSTGYGQVSRNGSPALAHRAAYELLVGPIPEGLTLDHECHNDSGCAVTDHSCLHRRCVNVEHLRPKPRGANVLASPNARANARKTHCPHGHPYDEANTYRPTRGGRMCRECARIRRSAKAV